MQKMASSFSQYPDDSLEHASADDPLLDLEAEDHQQQPEGTLQKRHRPTATVTLLLAAGFLGVIIVALAVSSSRNDHNGQANCGLPPKMIPAEEDPGVAAGVSSKTFRPDTRGSSPLYSWSDDLLKWQKTAFHFQPEKNWMNDPNGPVLYNGRYHFFYQYNPFGAIWGNIVWGHAVSQDLIHWQHLPIAMAPDQWYDINGVWTGSATILQDGQLIMLYTGSTNESVQVQNLAYPANSSDPFLVEWVKYSGNPVLVPPHGIKPKDFRDPTTAWLTPEGKWRLTIGSKINTTGVSLVYDTKDFKSYELHDELLHAVAGTGMWECVDFYPVSTTDDQGLDTSVDGSEVKHIIKTSLDDDRRDYYAIGTYDSHSATWKPDDPAVDAGIGLRYDYGTFYASKTFYDQEKKRRILWGWIKETDSEAADVKKGWASVQAIPRTILFDRKTKSNLLQWPVEEITKLRLGDKVFNKVEAKPGSVVPLDVGSTSELDIMAEFEIDKEALERANVANEGYNCSTSGGAAQRGALGPFGLMIHSYKDLTEQTPVYFYIYKDNLGDFKTSFCADQSRSSEAPDVDKSIYGSTVTVLKDEKLCMRILVDHSIVESFAQGGRTCITSRIYPTKAVYQDSRVFLFNNATDVKITASIKMWQLSHPSHAHVHSVSLLASLLPILMLLVVFSY